MRTQHLSISQSLREPILPKNGKRGKPLRTFSELCEEFGVKPGELKACLRNDKNSPKAKFTAGSSFSGTNNTWYDPDEMRNWWKSKSK